MKTYTLTRQQIFKKPIRQVFAFFEKPENLERITPKSLGFRILTLKPIIMKMGLVIEYTIRPFLLPMRWKSLITDYQAPRKFVDEQLQGPYASWHHTHTFAEVDGGTLVTDKVRYALGWGFLGQLAHFLLVQHQLNHIFNYREKVIADYFESEQADLDWQGGWRSNMNIVITGGTGFVGKALIPKLIEEKHRVTLLTRNPESIKGKFDDAVKLIKWDGETLGDWKQCINGADAVINLAGEPIAGKRWTAAQKKRISDSRILGTRVIAEAIEKSDIKPEVLINASAIGFYGPVEEGDVIESATKGEGFLADVCDLWEKETGRVAGLGVRVVLMRIGVVLERGGGAMEKMIPPFKMFVGGPLGSGKQWFPWIHRDDIVEIVLFALQNSNISGPVNSTAPNPVRMNEFCSKLGKVMNRPSWAPVPSFMLKLMLGEMSEMLLKGQKVIPQKLKEAGFQFKHADLEESLKSILVD